MSLERSDLTASAVKINGSYIEDLVNGFTTLSSTGREALAKEITTNSFSNNGSTFFNSRYPERTITVKYILGANNRADYLTNYQKLMSLSQNNVDIQFNDDSTKFYNGSITINEPEERLGNAAVGTINILCTNPFKYSTDVKTVINPVVDGNTATFTFNYAGTYPARPLLRAEFASATSGGDLTQDGDCGFIAFIDNAEHIIQVGNPNTLSLAESATAETLANHTFTNNTGWLTTGGATWENRTVNGSITFNEAITDINWAEGTGQTLYCAKPTYGATTSGWSGSILHKNLGTEGAQNFEMAAVHRLNISANKELGCFEFAAYNVTDGEYKMVAGIVIDKTASGTTGIVKYIVNGKQVGTAKIDLAQYNVNFGFCNKTEVKQTQWYKGTETSWTKVSGWKTRKAVSGYKYTQSNLNTVIRKDGSQYTFNVGELPVFTWTEAGTELLITNDVSVYFGAYKTSNKLNTNAVNSIKFIRLAGTEFLDTANMFTADDIVEADCNSASITIKRKGTEIGHSAPQYGALGNHWENFLIVPGTNTITATWSDWVNPDYKPTLKILYNEVYL